MEKQIIKISRKKIIEVSLTRILTCGFKSGLISVVVSILFFSCAADYNFTNNTANTSTPLTQQSNYETGLNSVRFTFDNNDYYSLTSPDPNTGCAGDANAFYDPIALVLPSYPAGYTGYMATVGPTGPVKLPTNLSDSSTTVRPSFIKNVSVDISDANSALSSNHALTCSFGNGITAPPPSSCATFDYGAIGGIPSLLGGTFIVIGGLHSVNYDGINSFGLSTPAAYNLNHGLTVGCGPIAPVSTLVAPNGFNNCDNSMYALGINSLPASAAGSSSAPGLAVASGPISSWTSLSGVTGYTGPAGEAGASAVYNDALRKILLFGGASPMTGLGSTGAGTTNYDTWIFSLTTQLWTLVGTNTVTAATIEENADLNPFLSSGSILSLTQKGEGGRSLFGFASVPGMGISEFGTTGLVTGTGASSIDTTDRLVIVGGYCSSGGTACQDVHILNPTFSPEYMDALLPYAPIIPQSGTSASVINRNGFPSQWLDSYYERVISNSASPSLYNPVYPAANPLPSPLPTPTDYAVSFGLVGLNNNSTTTSNVGPSNATTTTGVGPSGGVSGSGYVAMAGGFHGFRSPSGVLNTPSLACPSITQCGNLEILTKWFSDVSGTLAPNPITAPATNPPPNPLGTYSVESVEKSASNFTSVANVSQNPEFIPQGIQNTPAEFVPIPDGTAPNQTPWYGGSVMLKGLNNANNDVVFFGGADCQNYMTDSTACPFWPSTKPNPGIYWTFGLNPAWTLFGAHGVSAPSYPSTIPMGGLSGTNPITPPINAGMAAARGADATGHPLIVAWGGMVQPTIPDSSSRIYYLYNNSGQPTWGVFTYPAGSGPPGLSNASLVFSHVTGNFYLFGGYSPTGGSSSSTWQLSLGSSAPSSTCGQTASAVCTFTWTLLDPNMTCYPNCPAGRRSHRMVEANYNYFNAPNEPDCHSSSSPCSFGLFMQGGTSDGVGTLSDRWMFDPTANGGAGHWQLTQDLPPRTLASMTNIDYQVPTTNSTVHRALLFGGETGMQNPYQAKAAGASGLGQSTGFFVPPTLGDTWMYDYISQTWNRVALYGQRFGTGSIPAFSNLSEADARSASLVSDSTTFQLSPPPIAGAVMVTRTQSKPNHAVTDPANTLAIPEVFLFGGRTKDGKFSAVNTVYKFCAGSTGEKPWPSSLRGTGVPLPDDASCDAYDPVTNPQSTSPVQGYVGRWLVKAPTEVGYSAGSVSSFMGSGTYDSLHDLIILYGGLLPTSYPGAAVTNSSGLTLDPSGTVYEYTPPSAVADKKPAHLNGSWNLVPACAEIPTSTGVPTGRYGHTIAYDPLNQQLTLMGGYDSDGNLLTQTLEGSGATTPEIWTAVRIDAAQANGIPSRNIPPITSTLPCYYWTPVSTFGNLPQSGPTTGIAHATGLFIPASGYNTGYYSTEDSACIGAGPIGSGDPAISRLLAGGAYIDIDRTQLGPHENLILNLTFMPLGLTNIAPNQSYLTSDQNAVFKIHLIKVGESGDTIRTRLQPRYSTYAATDRYPEIVKDLSFVSPPTGQIRQEQVYIPLSADPTIDRIRIERYSGNAILIEASVFRLGHN